jgi:hypothetical protein
MKATLSVREPKTTKVATRKKVAAETPHKVAAPVPSMSAQLRELRESVDAINRHAEHVLKQLL